MTGAEQDQRQTRADTRSQALSAIRQELAILAKTLPGDLCHIRVTSGGHTVEVEWAPTQGPGTPSTADGILDIPPEQSSPAEAADADRCAVRAPLVGTFYRAPQPGAQPFVAPGDQVQKGDTVGIVEAMKLMNHVAADVAGRVVEVLAGDGDPVEYDQPLVVLEPLEQGSAS